MLGFHLLSPSVWGILYLPVLLFSQETYQLFVLPEVSCWKLEPQLKIQLLFVLPEVSCWKLESQLKIQRELEDYVSPDPFFCESRDALPGEPFESKGQGSHSFQARMSWRLKGLVRRCFSRQCYRMKAGNRFLLSLHSEWHVLSGQKLGDSSVRALSCSVKPSPPSCLTNFIKEFNNKMKEKDVDDLLACKGLLGKVKLGKKKKLWIFANPHLESVECPGIPYYRCFINKKFRTFSGNEGSVLLAR